MSRITIPARESVPEASKPILDAVEKKLGVVPNMFRVIALSPAALSAYAGMNGALSHALDLKTREVIALAVAQVNGCDYCLSAHHYLGLNLAKLSADDIALARQGHAGDPKMDAAAQFARVVTDKRGQVSDADLAAVKAAGYSEAQLVEIIAVTAENILTNLLNRVAQTDIDFPVVTA
jgi:uncharacterized peroxidase-related enzyme